MVNRVAPCKEKDEDTGVAKVVQQMQNDDTLEALTASWPCPLKLRVLLAQALRRVWTQRQRRPTWTCS
jgi:hypothetical protein